jgi:hypothetical protein
MTDQRMHDDLVITQTAQDRLAEMEARWKRAAAETTEEGDDGI